MNCHNASCLETEVVMHVGGCEVLTLLSRVAVTWERLIHTYSVIVYGLPF